MIELEILGEPKALQRARHGGGRTWDPRENKVNKDSVRFAFAQTRALPFEKDIALEMVVTCYFPRPRAHFGTGKNANLLKASAPRFHTKRPDGDNLLKLVKDALNECAYFDDAQIVDARVVKAYAKPLHAPYTLVTLRAVPFGAPNFDANIVGPAEGSD